MLLELRSNILVSYYCIAMESSYEQSPGLDRDDYSRDRDHHDVRYFLVMRLLLFA